jgi:hypothetical protein
LSTLFLICFSKRKTHFQTQQKHYQRNSKINYQNT